MNTFSLFYQFLASFSFLVLASVGLAVIFGVMNVINFAHASFIMLGAVFTVSLVNHAGIPHALAVLLAILGVAVVGMAIEWLFIRRLYRRILDCLLATWAINMIIVQIVFLIIGSSQRGIPAPFGSFTVGGITYATYTLVILAFAFLVIGFLYWLFRHTDFGLRVRAAMQNKDMAEGLGTRTSTLYSVTFGLGAGLAGLTGALYAPMMPITPFFGDQFLWRAFTVVIVGGADPLIGPLASGAALGLVYSGLTWFWGTIVGSIGLLAVTMVFIRLFPAGFTGAMQRFRGRGGS
ncbi:MAG: branched-chain amino acid ABC transporter permease [Azospirillaceae bacterium]